MSISLLLSSNLDGQVKGIGNEVGFLRDLVVVGCKWSFIAMQSYTSQCLNIRKLNKTKGRIFEPCSTQNAFFRIKIITWLTQKVQKLKPRSGWLQMKRQIVTLFATLGGNNKRPTTSVSKTTMTTTVKKKHNKQEQYRIFLWFIFFISQNIDFSLFDTSEGTMIAPSVYYLVYVLILFYWYIVYICIEML